MACIEEIGWVNLIIGGIIGTLIGLFAQRFLDYVFGLRYLRPLIGEYTVTYKNGKELKKVQKVNITNAKGRILFIETKHDKEASPIRSEIYFNTPKSGSGWYLHTDSDSFGLREVIIINNEKIATWTRYTKDGAYIKSEGNAHRNDPKMFSSIDQSYIWTKIKTQ